MTAEAMEINQTLQQAQKALYDGQFAQAIAAVFGILQQHPDHSDALYMLAVAQRYGGQARHAQETLDRLLTLNPDFGRAYQECGHLYREIPDMDRALHAYVQACQCNPALTASWRAQAEIRRERGQSRAAEIAAAQADRLAALPKELLAVSHYLHEGKLLKAEKLCRAFLQKHPKDTEAMRLLADVACRYGVMEEAEFLLDSAIAFAPENIQLRLDFIEVLRKRQKFRDALAQAKLLYDREPDNPVFQSHYAIESLQAGEYDQALSLFDQILEALPDDPATLTSRGHALKTLGHQAEAIASYRRVFDKTPGHGDAWYGLANLKTYRFTEGERTMMRAQEKDGLLSGASRVQLYFSLGKAYEDAANYDQAFVYYTKGNDLKRAQSRYDADQMTEELQVQAAVCTGDLFQSRKGQGCPAPDPIFIVGLPRAGSTLLEQILASHSQVDGTLELPNILSLAHGLRNRQKITSETGYPRNLNSLSAEELTELGERYIRETAQHRADAPFFTDKMPNNFRHIGLIKLILPNAKIIDARRDPMACCFSGFKQLFAEGQEFTYGLEQVGRYYHDYVDLMAHWDRVLPGQILRVRYEEVVADLEGQVRRILEYCGLDFEEACVNFHKTARTVKTASSEQVREKINTKGLKQWQHFEAHLGPLKEALEGY